MENNVFHHEATPFRRHDHLVIESGDVRLAREDIKESSPRLSGVVSDCIGLARIILNQIVR
jgi:hypothetical protein